SPAGAPDRDRSLAGYSQEEVAFPRAKLRRASLFQNGEDCLIPLVQADRLAQINCRNRGRVLFIGRGEDEPLRQVRFRRLRSRVKLAALDPAKNGARDDDVELRLRNEG